MADFQIISLLVPASFPPLQPIQLTIIAAHTRLVLYTFIII